MSKKRFFSILIMRDDKPVRSLRMKGKTLRGVLFLALFLLTLCVTGVLVSARYMDRYYTLQSEHKGLQKKYVEARLELEQLTNVKTLVEQSGNGNLTLKNDEVTPEQISLQENATAEVYAALNATIGVTNAYNAETNATAPTVEGNIKNDSEPDPLKNIPTLEDVASPLEITDFMWRKVGQQQLHISYTLSTKKGTYVAGKAIYYGVTKNGTTEALAVSNRGETRFAISRLKPMESTVIVPKDFDIDSLSSLKAVLELDNKSKFLYIQPLAE